MVVIFEIILLHDCVFKFDKMVYSAFVIRNLNLKFEKNKIKSL